MYLLGTLMCMYAFQNNHTKQNDLELYLICAKDSVLVQNICFQRLKAEASPALKLP